MFFRKYKRVIIIILALLLAILMVLPTLASVLSASAAEMTSDELAEIRKAIGAELDAVGGELDGLQGSADELGGQMDALMGKLNENKDETRSVIDQKYDLDQQVDILRQQVDNTNSQIQQYNKLIATRQQELDIAMEAEEAQQTKYKERIRAMEENGQITYLEILFNAGSFTDLLDSIDLIREIAESDQRLIEQMKQSRQAVEEAQAALEVEKENLGEKKTLLAQQEAELEAQRLAANAVITSLDQEADEYKSEYAVYEEEEAALQKDIMAMVAEFEAKQAEYNEALAREQMVRAREEEAERLRREAAIAASATTKVSSTSGDAEYYTSYSTATASESGFITPVPAGSWTVTDGFGNRIHPITGANSFHTGVDLAANSGTNIYASKSGTVVTASTSSAYGNYVVISHGSGQATLYAHMSSMAVSSGDYVTQGQTIGYVGSTGWSTGPHLHFEIMIDGDYYNPMAYIG